MRRRARVAAFFAALLAAVPVLSGCGSNTGAAKNAVLAAITRTLDSARTFTFVDHDLVNTTTVSGSIEDDQRYALLLATQGVPQWQMVARDDAVADFFSQRSAVDVYTGSGYGPEDDVQTAFQQVRPLLPASTNDTIAGMYATKLPRPTVLGASLGLAALRAGKWVIDPAGAPHGFGGVADAGKQSMTNPFFEPMTLLQDLQQRVQMTNRLYIRLWQKNDLQPVFKATDDPFPAPMAGEARYDLYEQPLPTNSFNTARGIPRAPTNDEFLKVAVYVRDGRVSAVRYNYDVLDRLDQVVKAYKLPAKFGKSVGVNLEEHVGQVVVDLLQGQAEPLPFRVHEETMLLGYPASPPQIVLPGPAVTASLAGVLPNQGNASPNPAASSAA